MREGVLNLIYWVLLLLGLGLFGIASIVYLSRCIHRFHLISRLSRGNARAAWLLSAAFVLVPAVLLWILLGYVNTVIVLLHFVLSYLLVTFVFFLLQKLLKKTFKRYYAGTVAFLLALIYLSVGWVQANHVWKTEYTIETEKPVGSLRIALIADSHIGATFHADGFARHLEQLQEERPDVVVVCGDFVDETTSKEDMIASCRALGKLQTPYGVYFVFGNHDKGWYANGRRSFDGDALTAELVKNNVTVLQDETVLIDHRFYLVGRRDASKDQDFDEERADMAELMSGLDGEKFSIVLDHQPQDYAAQATADVDLVLSGHTHGGQLFPLAQLIRWFHLGGDDGVYGLERRANTSFIVTSGISDWAMKFRTGCRSEYVIINVIEK